MLFNSVEFAVFFVVVLALYWQLRGRARNALLLVGSYVFYGLWDWRFLGLLALSTVVDFTIGNLLGRTVEPRRRSSLLVVSMVVNLGILGIFKYANFFVDSAVSLLADVGLEPNEPFLQVVLPVGISFYTFQTMSYTIDVYRRRLEPVPDLLVFATFVAYFPQLVAGPIERARILLPQLIGNERSIDEDKVISGLALILLGLFKKVVLADGVAAIADRAFDDPAGLSWLAVATGVVAFAIQIYGDFSGYTDVARGVSRLLGIELTVNFTQPYLSRNITEFWRRWHISLSNWLRDYLYIPLGGNRAGPVRTYVNLVLTMLLGGLWHGASWNFVVWGGLHGGYLVVHRLVRGGRVDDRPVRGRDLPAVATTFALVCAAWIFFRAADFGAAAAVYRALALQPGRTSLADVALVAVTFAVTVAVDVAARRDLVGVDTVSRRPAGVGSLVGLGLVGIVLFSGGTPRPFVYFQF
jgi:D-alanyl-lipoteichoic acid acyltransferase DltB (MBOAT superfamily)